MRFLRLLFWSFVVLLVLLFLGRNWNDVTVDLWGNIEADVKLPLLLVIAALIGWLPTSLAWRLKLARLRRSQAIAAVPGSPTPAADPAP